MKTFGYVVFFAAALGAGLYFGGFVDGSTEVKVTDKGRQTMSDGVDAVKRGISSGLQSVQDGVNEGLSEARKGVESNPE